MTSRTLSGDPFDDRRPTSHERLTGLPWDASYHDGPAPWDIGQPQPAIVRLAAEHGFVPAGAVGAEVSDGADVVALEPERIQTRFHDDGAPAWFATIKRI